MAQPKKYQHVKRIKTSKITIFQLVMKLTIILVWFCSSKEIRGKENRAKNDSLYVSNGIYKQSKYSIIKQKIQSKGWSIQSINFKTIKSYMY